MPRDGRAIITTTTLSNLSTTTLWEGIYEFFLGEKNDGALSSHQVPMGGSSASSSASGAQRTTGQVDQFHICRILVSIFGQGEYIVLAVGCRMRWIHNWLFLSHFRKYILYGMYVPVLMILQE